MVQQLGIGLGHDASVTVLAGDGTVLFAANEERFNRIKSYWGWPRESLKMVEPGEYAVSFGGQESAFTSVEKRLQQFYFRENREYFDILNERRWHMRLGSRRRESMVPRMLDALKTQGILASSIDFWDHHLCHAASAFYTSGWESALVFTADGLGDGRSATAYLMEGSSAQLLSSTFFPHSPGHMYAWATRILGYKISRHEGKLTGLAAYGNPSNLGRLRGELLRDDAQGNSLVNPYVERSEVSNSGVTAPTERFRSLFSSKPNFPTYDRFASTVRESVGDNYAPEDLAAVAQEDLESAITAWIQRLVRETGATDLCLAGGVFSNVRLNGRISNLPNITNVWVFPDMGDGGLSTGAAYLSLVAREPETRAMPMTTAALGPEYSDEEILEACDRHGVSRRVVDDPAYEAAWLVSQGAVVAWFQGRMEFGPRALGQRSLLVHPGDRSANDRVNARLGRTEFMPFAPSVLAEAMEDLFLTSKASTQCNGFMTVTYTVRDEWQERLQAVTHVDGTARPQAVDARYSPLYWSLLKHFRDLTGLPAIVNTSFNMHEEPIVCSPDDAIRSFRKGASDVLIMGNVMVSGD